MVVMGCVVVEFTSTLFGLLADEFVIQMVTISFWILPVTSAA